MVKLIPVEDEVSPSTARLVPVEDEKPARPKGPPPGAAERLERGALDVGQGLKQLYLMATNPAEAKRYTADVNAQIADYEGRRGPDAGIDWLRGGGNVAVQAPLMLVPGGQATLLPRLAMGAVAGAAGAGSQFSEAGTWEDKGKQTLVGAGVGALVPEAVRQGVKGVVAGAQVAKNAVQPVIQRMIPDQEIIVNIQNAGIDVGQMTQRARERLLADARRQLSVSGELDPAALARMRDYETIGVTPTLGQVTKDPRQWQTERNLAQVQGVGEDLLARFSGQPGQVRVALEGMRTGTATNALDAGRSAMEAVGSRVERSGVYGALGQNIDAAFDAARNAPGAQAVLPFESFQARIGGIVDAFEDAIPAPITRRIGQFADPENARPFTIAEAAKFRELLNARAGDGNPATAKALGQIKRELDTFMRTQADAVGDEGVEAIRLFRQGVERSAQRAREFDAPPLQAAVDRSVAPDDYFSRFVIGGKVDDLARLRAALSRPGMEPELAAQGQQAWANMRGQTIQWLLDKASRDGENFSQASYRNALQALGPRIDILFSPEERAMLQTIQRASAGLFADPVTGGVPLVNRSGTAAAVANMLARAQMVPGVGNLAQPVAQALQGQSQLAQVGRALNAQAADPAVRNAIQQAFRLDLANRAIAPGGRNVLSAPAAALIEQQRGLLD